MNKKSIIVYFLAVSSIVGCVKNVDSFTDFSTTKPILEMKTGVLPNGGYTNIAGLPNFGSAALSGIPSLFPNDTVSFYVNLASANAMSTDLTVNVGINTVAMDDYNADPSHALKYEMMPDSVYTWTDQTVTIPAGEHIALVDGLIFHYDKIDPTKNYMLPIGILDGGDITVSANMGTIYFHSIGNPLAGSYSWEWIRYNTSDTTSGVPDFDLDLSPALFAPVNATTVQTESGTGTVYILSFTNNGGVLSDFNVVFDPASTAGITITSGPTILTADPVNGVFRFFFTYNNAAGDPRCITDVYTR